MAFLVAHSEAGLIAPAVWDGSGQRRDLCKCYPTLLDLALRGFAPSWLRQRFQQKAVDADVFVGMRYGNPSQVEVFKTIHNEHGFDRVLVLPLDQLRRRPE